MIRAARHWIEVVDSENRTIECNLWSNDDRLTVYVQPVQRSNIRDSRATRGTERGERCFQPRFGRWFGEVDVRL